MNIMLAWGRVALTSNMQWALKGVALRRDDRSTLQGLGLWGSMGCILGGSGGLSLSD